MDLFVGGSRRVHCLITVSGDFALVLLLQPTFVYMISQIKTLCSDEKCLHNVNQIKYRITDKENIRLDEISLSETKRQC